MHMQVLHLEGCRDLRASPENMSALINLRHLHANRDLVSSIRGLGRLTALQELDFDCGRQKMRELADMDMLRQLQISSLEEVKSKEEASDSRLDKKGDLEELEMTWNRPRMTTTSVINPGLDEEVVGGLKPASNTRRLTIVGYGGIRSPGWMDDQSWLSSSSSLERLELRDCTNWEVLPPLGQLPCLRFLQIQGMDKVRQLPPLPPTLTQLVIFEVGLTHLPGWWWGLPPSSILSSSSSSPALSDLSIARCPNLTSLADGLLRHPDLHNLQKLEIRDCQDLVSLPETALGHLTSLESLSVVDCPKLSRPTSSVEHPLPSSLRYLSIRGCDGVGDVLLASGCQNMNSLTRMTIAGRCRFGRRRRTRSAGKHSTSDRTPPLPSSLRELSISSNEELGDECLSTWLRGLTSLTSLSIYDCPAITSLPRAEEEHEVLSHLTALESLSIALSRGLKSLGGIHSLVSLEELTINDCPQLQDIITAAAATAADKAAAAAAASHNNSNNNSPRCTSPSSSSPTAVMAAPQLTRLRSLLILRSSTRQMKAWLLQCPSLQTLRIGGCPQLTGFGAGDGGGDDCGGDVGSGGGPALLEMALLRSAPTLRHLRFVVCENLRSLPPNLRCLSSLESLEMKFCPQIRSLPPLGLPESLRSLSIHGCPALVERCKEEEGADWPLISHINELHIC